MVREEEEEHMVNGIALNMMLRLQWFVWEWDKSVFSVILAENKVKCFEVTEVNPTLDEKKNVMAETVFRILKSATKNIEAYR